MGKIFKISNKTLSKIQAEMNWRGTGSQEDPIIIDSINGVINVVIFKNISKYIRIKNISLWRLKLMRCQNITIENSEIAFLKILGSSHINIMNSKILVGTLYYCRDSIFKNNVYDPDSNINFSENGAKMAEKKIDRLIKLILVIFLIIVITAVLFFIFLSYFNGVYFLILSLWPLAFELYLRDKRRFVKALGPIIFENNKSGDLRHLDSDLFHKI
jgi:hypothetical protein